MSATPPIPSNIGNQARGIDVDQRPFGEEILSSYDETPACGTTRAIFGCDNLRRA
jgi:hypothetical protein